MKNLCLIIMMLYFCSCSSLMGNPRDPVKDYIRGLKEARKQVQEEHVEWIELPVPQQSAGKISRNSLDDA